MVEQLSAPHDVLCYVELSVFLLHSENSSLNFSVDYMNVSDVKGIILCECVMIYL